MVTDPRASSGAAAGAAARAAAAAATSSGAEDATPAAAALPPRPRSKRQEQRRSYLVTAVAATTFVSFLAFAATYARFTLQLEEGGSFPWVEFASTVALVGGAAVGMEYWARWAHKYLWHASMWTLEDSLRGDWNRRVWGLHESHHLPREGAYEANDIFAIINAVPAIALCAYGFFHEGEAAGLVFGAGLGVTLFGMAYMFVHDGLIHKRFPVGPIASVPYFQRLEAAHKIHHADKYEGAPWGLFLAEQELEELGIMHELEAVLEAQEAALGVQQRS